MTSHRSCHSPIHLARGNNIFGAHPHSQLYRYRLPQDEEGWSYVLLWESDQ